MCRIAPCILILLSLTVSCDGDQTTACEGHLLTIHCPFGYYIDVIHAVYGRDRGPSVCPHAAMLVTSGCSSGVSLSRVWNSCQGRTTCGIPASNNIFGDPCVGTYKFLRVEYKCAAYKRARVCEHGTMHLLCPRDKTLSITDASYGRNAGQEVCPSSSMLQVSGCRASASKQIVSEACEGKLVCSVSASNGVFGDPCYGTYKYLEVTYSCT